MQPGNAAVLLLLSVAVHHELDGCSSGVQSSSQHLRAWCAGLCTSHSERFCSAIHLLQGVDYK